MHPGYYGNHPHGWIVNGVDDVLKATRENFKFGADAVKIMVTNEYGAMSMTSEEIRAAVQMAKAHNATSCAHASGVQSIRTLVEAGITSIEHGTIVDEECAQMMKDEGVYLVPTLLAMETIIKRSELEGEIHDLDSIEEEQRKAQESFDIYIDKGVKIGFGSDAAIPYIEHGKQAKEFQLMVNMGMTPAKVLKAATKTNAELLGWEEEVGTIEIGKYADIVAFDENPLEDMKAMEVCDFVMKDGVVYKEDGTGILNLK